MQYWGEQSTYHFDNIQKAYKGGARWTIITKTGNLVGAIVFLSHCFMSKYLLNFYSLQFSATSCQALSHFAPSLGYCSRSCGTLIYSHPTPVVYLTASFISNSVFQPLMAVAITTHRDSLWEGNVSTVVLLTKFEYYCRINKNFGVNIGIGFKVCFIGP